MDLDPDLLERLVREAESLGASYAEVRFQRYSYELLRAENGVLKDYQRVYRAGVGVRVLYHGRLGFSSTNSSRREDLFKAVGEAVAAARASEDRVALSDADGKGGSFSTRFAKDPALVPPEEKIRLVVEINREAFSIDGIKSSITLLGIQRDQRRVISSDSRASWEVVLTGVSQTSVAGEAGSLEKVHNSRSRASGWEFVEGGDWAAFARDVSATAVKALKAPMPPAGRIRAVADPELVGLILHEAFGHASEGDLVTGGTSVLRNRLGTAVASEEVTIVDDGLVEGGFPVPFDDEGTPKTATTVVEKGVLRSFLTDRVSASKLGLRATGNGRAQDFSNPPIVRQTNIYMLPGSWRAEEMIREAGEGIYLVGKGAGGGQVDTGAGTFTFSAGPSYMIRRGELAELVRGVVISGYILETLRGVEAVGRDLSVRTSVFGGCGKEGQLVRVGDGGPHVMFRELVVGGR